jgi:hypothetical protein
MVSSPGLYSKKNKVWVPKGKASPFHDGPRNDQLLAMVMALTVEVSILRERLDTHERVSERSGGFGTKAVEVFDPDVNEQAERSSLRKRIVDKVFRVLREEPKT